MFKDFPALRSIGTGLAVDKMSCVIVTQNRQWVRAEVLKQPLGSDFRALRQGGKFCPCDVAGHPAHTCGSIETAIGAGHDASRIAERTRCAFDALGDELRVLDEIGSDVNHAGNQYAIVAECVAVETTQLMGVTWIGEWQHEAAVRPAERCA